VSIPPRQKWQDDGNGDQDDDDPLQHLHAAGRGLIGHFFVDTFERLQLAENPGIPLGQMKALGDQTIDSRQILIAKEFQGIIHPFEQNGAIHLHAGNALQARAE
jgi:hypothetical protein